MIWEPMKMGYRCDISDTLHCEIRIKRCNGMYNKYLYYHGNLIRTTAKTERKYYIDGGMLKEKKFNDAFGSFVEELDKLCSIIKMSIQDGGEKTS